MRIVRALLAVVSLAFVSFEARAQEAPSPAASPEASPEASPLPAIELGPSPIGDHAPSAIQTVELPKRLPRPWIAAWSSAFIPGGGFWYLRRPLPALGYEAMETAELAAMIESLRQSGYDKNDPKTYDRSNRIVLAGLWLQNTHAEGIYEAYRAARIARNNLGYRTPIPEPGLDGLLRAPFQWRTLVRPRIGLPLVALAAGGVAYSFWYRSVAPPDSPTFWDVSRLPLFSVERPKGQTFAAGEGLYAAGFYTVGIGEESLFRGVLQTTFDEWFGPTAGIIVGGVVFGCAHFANNPGNPAAGIFQVSLTTLLGMGLGWSYVDDGYDLRGGVAFHAWYDFVVGTTFFLCDPKHQPFVARVAIPF